MFKDKKRALLGIFLTLFVASLIIFDLPQNVKYNNILNIFLFLLFGTIFIFEKDYKIPISNITIAYFIFSIFAFSSMFWSVDFSLAYRYWTRLIIATLNLLILYIIFSRYRLEQTILYGIIVGGLYNILIGLNIIHPNYEIFEFGRFTGTLGNSNKIAKTMLLDIFSSLVLLSLPTTKDWFRLFNKINIILAIYIIVLTVSKKAIILAPFMLIFSLSFKSLKIKEILLFIILLSIGVKLLFLYGDMEQLNHLEELINRRFLGLIDMAEGIGGDDSTRERVYLVEEGLKIFYNNPIFGIGLNNARHFLIKYTHNNYLELLIGVGIIGTMMFYSIYIITIRYIYLMPQSQIKKYFYIMIFTLLLLDTATVTYYTKPILFIVLYIYFVAEQNILINKKIT